MNGHTWRRRRWALLRSWHRIRFGVSVPPSMLAQTGRGKYVSVIRRGPYVDVADHRSGETIRLIPYQPNHGFMVELHAADGALRWRTHLDFVALRNLAAGGEDSGNG